MAELPAGLQGLQFGVGLGENLLTNLINRQRARQQMDIDRQKFIQEKSLYPLDLQLKRAQIEQALRASQQSKQKMDFLQDAINRLKASKGQQQTTQQQLPIDQPEITTQGISTTPDIPSGEVTTRIPQSENEWESLRKQSGYTFGAEQASQEGELQDLVAHALGYKPNVSYQDGLEITHNPLFGTRQRQVSPNPFQKELLKKDAQVISDLEKGRIEMQPLITTQSKLKDVIESPVYQQLTSFPFYRRNQLSYLQKKGTPEQQKVISQFLTLSGDIIKQSARDFKGPFRIGEQALLNEMKPSPDDTPDAALAKINMLLENNHLNAKLYELMPRLMREHQIGASSAFEIVKRQLKLDNYEKQVRNRLKELNQKNNTSVGATNKTGFDFNQFKIRGE